MMEWGQNMPDIRDICFMQPVQHRKLESDFALALFFPEHKEQVIGAAEQPRSYNKLQNAPDSPNFTVAASLSGGNL